MTHASQGMLLVLVLAGAGSGLAATLTDLRTEYLENPLGLDRPRPRFQWTLVDPARGLAQVSYRIKISTGGGADGSVWDSGMVASNKTYQIEYAGPALVSATVYRWAVTVTTAAAGVAGTSTASSSALFSMGMLESADWDGATGPAQFIGHNTKRGLGKPPTPPSIGGTPWFRKSFTMPAGLDLDGATTALVHLASVGFHELYVNGEMAAPDAVLLPSISYLPKRVLYRTYNVSGMLRPGEANVLAVWGAAGWGAYGDLHHGIATSAIPLILVKMTAGPFSVVSDATWKTMGSNLVSHGGGPGGGEAIDGANANPDWSTLGLNDSDWEPAVPLPVSGFPGVAISADAMEPTRRESTVSAATVTAIARLASEPPQGPAGLAEQAGWWGPASLREKPASFSSSSPEPFCGTATVQPNDPGQTKYEGLKLTCTSKGDQIAAIDFAVWGVPTRGSGSGCSAWKAGDPCGSVAKTTAWVQSLCVGKQSCTLDPIHNGKDPCPDKVKTLVVAATCKLGDGNATVINAGPSPPGPPPPGTWLVTMSELYTGWFEVNNMKGPAGSTVNFQVSTTAGKPLEYGMADSYTFGPSGTGSFRMRFAYHEIHYITITGLEAAPGLSDVVGHRLTSLGERTGDFECSSSLISKMYTTTVNNYRGLTTGGMSVDCPHRERRGYGGDGHTSYQFALANYPVGAFFNKWQRDFADVQGVPGGFGTPAGTGLVPNTAPTVGGGGGPAWGGFVVTAPWQTYNTFGDEAILRDMYPTMITLLAFYTNNTKATDGLLHPWDSSKWDFLGDWITPHGSEGTVSSPENLLFNNCYLHYITHLVSKIAAILNKDADATKYAADADRIAAAVNKAFGNASSGVFLDQLQTHAVMPLATGVVPASVAPLTWANLENQLKVVDTGHLDTGLTGTYFMTKVMMEAGRNDLVFTWANKTDFPSYGHFLELGYTTWPEQWNVANGDSLMHGCYNAIGVWFVEGVAGIRVHASESPPLTIRAGVDAGDITWASGRRSALHGEASSSWTLLAAGGSFEHNVTVPGGGVAKVMIPSPNGQQGVSEGGKPVAGVVGVTVIGTETINQIDYVSLKVLAGSYSFGSAYRRLAVPVIRE